jgi:hypothetical protein
MKTKKLRHHQKLLLMILTLTHTQFTHWHREIDLRIICRTMRISMISLIIISKLMTTLTHLNWKIRSTCKRQISTRKMQQSMPKKKKITFKPNTIDLLTTNMIVLSITCLSPKQTHLYKYLSHSND